MKRIGVLCLLLCLLLCGCGGDQPVKGTHFAMDTVLSFTVYGAKGKQALAEAETLMDELDAALSVTDENSQIARYNRGEPDALSPETERLIRQGDALEKETEGAFSPRLGALTGLWGFSSDTPHRPEREALEAAKGDRSRLDLGGIAKGYAAGRLREAWEALGIKSALAALGGNVLALGEKPDGSPWRIGIRDPFGGQEDLLGALEVRDTCVVTSGGYERNFTEDGVTYHHILDPETGFPADSGLASVTVVCRDAARADALSTALFVLGREKALDFWRGSEGLELILVEQDGTVTVTDGLWDAFSGTGEDFTYVREA